jgi:transcriptional regulator with XRE-family HTH domain
VPLANQPSKRRRGVILTAQGWQRLQGAKHDSEVQDNSGTAYTLEELSDRTKLSLNTLTKIQRRQIPVDRQSLEQYFKAFNLTLNREDYSKFDRDSIESQQKVTLKGQVPLNSPFYIERPPIEAVISRPFYRSLYSVKY